MRSNRLLLTTTFLASGLAQGSVLIDDFTTGPANIYTWTYPRVIFQPLPSVFGGTRALHIEGGGTEYSMGVGGGTLNATSQSFTDSGYSRQIVSWGYTGINAQNELVGDPNRNFTFPGGMVFRVTGSQLHVGRMSIILRNWNGGYSITSGVQETATSIVFNCANPYHVDSPFDLSSVDVISLVLGDYNYDSYVFYVSSISGGTAQANLTGTLTLADMVANGFNRSIGYTLKQGTATVASGTITATASSSPLAISVPASATGAAQLTLDGSSFLKRVVNLNLTGANLSLGAVTLRNGDVDNSGEVDAVDIDTVIAAFGSIQNIVEDVDGSGEVDAVDIDITIANFGGVND